MNFLGKHLLVNNLPSARTIFPGIKKENVSISYFFKIRGRMLCFLLFISQQIFAPAQAAEIRLLTTAGYDDNPALTNHAKGSAFTFHDLGLAGKITLSDKLDLTLQFDGAYTNYTKVDDNFSLQAGGELTGTAISDRFIPSFLGGITLYRDSYVREDDRNEYMFGFRFSRIHSRHHTFGIKTTYTRLDYRNDARPYSGRTPAPQSDGGVTMPGLAATPRAEPHQSGMNRQAAATMQNRLEPGGRGVERFFFPPGMMIRMPVLTMLASSSMRRMHEVQRLSTRFSARDDNLYTIHLYDNLFLTPQLNGTAYAGFAWLDSSLDLESYRQWYMGGEMGWDFREQWQLSLNAAWAQLDYYQGVDPFDRTDMTFSTGLRVSRFIKPVELFCQSDWLKSNSDLHTEFYHQTVSQCGLSWSF